MNRTWFTLLACLLGVSAGWLLTRICFNSRVATPPSQTAPDSISVAEAVTHSTPPRKLLNVVRAEPVQAKRESRQATGALTNSESPINSQDLDQNREWARNFPGEAMEWLRNAADGGQRINIAEIVCSDMAQTNPAAAVSLAESCQGGGTNNVARNLLDNLAQQWARKDMAAASVWALAKPLGEQRDSLLQRIALVQAEASPADAARLVSEQMSAGEFQNEAAISVLHQWTKQDPAAALAWAESFPAGDLRDRAINEVKNVSAVLAGPAP